MSLPYETASSGERAVQDMQKILQGFGCSSFGHMMDFEAGELLVQFKHRGRPITVKASVNGYAAAWLKQHAGKQQRTKKSRERQAREVASVAVYSILRDWIKGQVTAIETGVLTFEGAFLGQILLPNGRTILEHVQTANLLPAPKE